MGSKGLSVPLCQSHLDLPTLSLRTNAATLQCLLAAELYCYNVHILWGRGGGRVHKVHGYMKKLFLGYEI